MLNHLQLPTLEHCRNLNRITMLYKITNNLIAVDPKLYLTPQPFCLSSYSVQELAIEDG
jgi:hypothetical protein